MLVLAVVAGACSGGGGEAVPDPPGDPVETPPDSVPVTTRAAPSTTAPPSDGPTAFDQIAALEADEETSELTVLLAEFSAFFGPVPGGPQIERDESIYPSATGLIERIDEYRDELTSEQIKVIDAAVEDVFGRDRIIAAFHIDDEVSGVSGFRSHPANLRPAVPAPPSLVAKVRSLEADLRAKLGGDPLDLSVAIVEPGTRGIDGARASLFEPGSPTRAAWAADDLEANCVLQITDRDFGESEINGLITHELFHCWHFHHVGLSAAAYNGVGKWVYEGIASYVGEQLGGFTRYAATWWPYYVVPRRGSRLSYPLYSASWDAIGFWSRIAEETDIWARIPAVLDAAATGGKAETFEAAVAGLGDRVSWIPAGVTHQPDWGAGWTADGPGMIKSPRSTKSVTITADDPFTATDGPATQRSYTITAEPVADADGTVLSLTGGGYGVVRVEPDDVVLPGGSIDVRYCLVRCECPDGPSPFTAARTRPGGVEMTAALMGGAAVSTTLTFAIQAFDPDTECEEPEPTPVPLTVPGVGGEQSGGLAGTWQASNPSLTAMFAAVFVDLDPTDEAGFGVQAVTGNLLMTLEAGGTGSLLYDGVTIFLDAESPIEQLTIDGGGTFDWGVTDGQLRVQGTSIQFVASSPTFGEFPLVIPETSALGGGISMFSFSPPSGSLILVPLGGTEGDVFFPTTWTRQ
jgi:hypothetical protein